MFKNTRKLMKQFIKTMLVAVALSQCFALTIEAQSSSSLEKAKAAERQRMERLNYEKACKKGTIEALKEYTSLYPNGQFIDDAKKRIADYKTWSIACDANTIDAYNTYIETSEFKVYAEAAQDSITELKSIMEWNSIKEEPSLSAIETFILTYPNSSRKEEAERVKHELTAVSLYNDGEYKAALEEFDAAGGRQSLATSNVPKYDDCIEEVDYQSINDNIISLAVFLKKHPQSKYYNEISNKLAILKAKQLDYTSDDNAYNDVRIYAKDMETWRIVESYIDAAKRQRTSYRRRIRAERIYDNGGYVMFGIEPGDLLLGMSDFCESDVLSYNVGVCMRIGNYKAPIQFEIGVKPGVIDWEFDDDYYDDDYYVCRFHMPVYAKLKLNIARISDSCMFYIAGMGFWNAIREEDVESEFSLGGGFGVAWRKIDLLFYYKQDIKEDKVYYNTKAYYGGISSIIYI